MVDHNQKRVKAREGWQVSDEVTRDLLEGLRGKGLDRSERWNSGVGVQLVLLAGSAPFNIMLDELDKIRPPKFSSDKLASLEVTQVASGSVVMITADNGLLKCIILGNIM